ncbi:uncharacterized protein At4g22758-like [Neltuma alba]|uniref:uncharacterized protein At4g22758 n=1 Tax=Neltuma alba TaxID=207710 RepID=UPI0010A3FEE6|nr:uncharacterized protein At4g22758-like [Prosopis alba]XP_028798324.1 uncharacterized protein At4g22758-like [Prosopis alba]
MLLSKPKKSQNANGKRLLISINVLGSAGPIRFVVYEEELVAAVIDNVLKLYAREGRLPVLGSDISGFLLYSPQVGSDALSPWDTIGSFGARNFMLCKKPQPAKEAEQASVAAALVRKGGSGSWKNWFNKSLSLKVSSH